MWLWVQVWILFMESFTDVPLPFNFIKASLIVIMVFFVHVFESSLLSQEVLAKSAV